MPNMHFDVCVVPNRYSRSQTLESTHYKLILQLTNLSKSATTASTNVRLLTSVRSHVNGQFVRACEASVTDLAWKRFLSGVLPKSGN